MGDRTRRENMRYQSQTSMISHASMVRESISSGQFAFSVVGILKILIIVLLLIAAAFFLSNEICSNTPQWYGWLFPLIAALSAILITFEYTAFVTGCVNKNLETWTKASIILSLIEFVVIIISSILTITLCSSGQLKHRIPGPLGIIASLLLATSAAVLYIKSNTEEVNTPESYPSHTDLPRRSVHV